MILSKSAKYAVRAAQCLAEEGGEEPLPVDEIAVRLGIPRNYLSKILHVMARSEMLISTRGPGGGFRLAVSADELTLSDIVRQFDDVPETTTCLLGHGRCSESDPCAAHERWAGARAAIMDFLDNTRLSDLSPERPLAGGPLVT